MSRRIGFVLHRPLGSETVATVLGLADRLLARGARVSVFAHDDAVTLSSGGTESAQAVAALLRRGLAGAGCDWVVESASSDAIGLTASQAPGVLPGDHADLWALVRTCDVVLTPGRSEGPA